MMLSLSSLAPPMAGYTLGAHSGNYQLFEAACWLGGLFLAALLPVVVVGLLRGR